MDEDDANAALNMARAMQGPLQPRLDVIRHDYALRMPDYLHALDVFVARLRRAGAGSAAPDMAEVFPDFALPDAKGKIWHLARLLANAPVVLSFHRGSWCDFCQLNMRALTEIEPAITALGGQILVIAPEKATKSAMFDTEAASGIPILRDIGLGVSTLLGLTCFVDDSLRGELELLEVDVSTANGGAGWFVPIPATFVLNAHGTVAARHVDPDPRTRMESQAIVQAATAIQSAARN